MADRPKKIMIIGSGHLHTHQVEALTRILCELDMESEVIEAPRGLGEAPHPPIVNRLRIESDDRHKKYRGQLPRRMGRRRGQRGRI